MKKNILNRIFALLLAMVMVLGMVPATAFHAHAADEHVADSGGKYFTDFSEAFEYTAERNGSNLDVKLLADCSSSQLLQLVNGAQIGIDLNNHKLDLTGGIEIKYGGLYITDRSEDGGGILTVSGRGICLNPDEGKEVSLLIEKATVTSDQTLIDINCDEDGCSADVVIDTGAKLEGKSVIDCTGSADIDIENVTLTATNAAIKLYSYDGAAADVTIINTDVSSDNGSCVLLEKGVSLTVVGTKAEPCTFSNNGRSSAISAQAGSTLDFEYVEVVNGTMSLSNCNATFENCTFPREITVSGADASFDGCNLNSFEIQSGGQVVCTGCTGFDDPTGFINDSHPGSLIIWENDTTANVYGEVKLTEDLTIPAGTTYNMIPYKKWDGTELTTKIVPGEYTVTNNGTILVDGAEHIHSGAETVVKKDNQKHHTQVVCPDCPIGYVYYKDEQDHKESREATCLESTYCEDCDSHYGELGGHKVDPTDGVCRLCNTFAAVVSMTENGTTAYYTSLEHAVNTITGEATIQLLADYTVTENRLYMSTPGLTLDLNGKTLTVPMAFIIGENGTVTVKDGASGGKLKFGSLNLDRGDLILQSGKIDCNKIDVCGTVTVNGGEVAGSIITQSENAVLTVTGGEVDTIGAWDDIGTVRLSGGSFTRISGESYNSSVDVSEYLADGYKYVDANTGADVNASVVVLNNVKVVCAHPADHPDSTAATCKNPAYCGLCKTSHGEPDSTKHGAMDSTTGKCPICDENIAVATLTQGSTTTYHTSFEDAVDAATGEVTIQLLENWTVAEDVYTISGKTLTLDLNGKTLTSKNFNVKDGTALTLKDNTGEGSLETYLINVGSGCKMLIQSGTVDTENNIYVFSELTVTGGTINGKINNQNDSAVVTVTGGYAETLSNWYYGTIRLSGGTFGNISGDPYATPSAKVSSLLADGFKFVDADTEDDVSADAYSVTKVKVVCAHPADHPDSTAATCKDPAYCGNCKTSYGELSSHATMDSATGKCSLCEKTIAVATLTQGGTTTYHASFEDAVNAVTGQAAIQLLCDSAEEYPNPNQDHPLPAQEIALDLNGKTLTVDWYPVVVEGGKLTVFDSTEAQAGKLISKGMSVYGEMLLESGTIDCNVDYNTLLLFGKLTVTGGKIENPSTSRSSLYMEPASEVRVSGGYVKHLSASYEGEDLNCKVTLSGGRFGTISTGNSTYSHGKHVNYILADGYKYVDTPTGTDAYGDVYEITNVTVSCIHPADCEGSIPATCAKGAYCAQCGEYYGDTVPHAIDNTTGLCKYNCGKEMALLSVTMGQTVNYYDDAATAFDDAANYTGTATVDLLDNVSAPNTYLQFPTAILLKLNGKTLELGSITIDGGSLTVEDTTGGAMELSSPNGGIHVNAGSFTLSSGTVRSLEGNAITVNNGTLTVNGGRVEAAQGHGIYLNDERAVVNITGGTIQSPGDQEFTTADAWKYGLCLNKGLGTISLSGGTFLGGIYTDSTSRYLASFMVPHYTLADLKTGAVTPNLNTTPAVWDDLQVVCAHDWDHKDDLAATCAKGAYCGYCMKYYSDPDPDSHGAMVLSADDTDNTITQTCSLECGYSKEIKLAVPTNAVYDGDAHPAVVEGDDLAYSLSYWQAGVELNAQPTEPGDYTAKLTVLDPAANTQYSVSADYSIARIAVTPDWITDYTVRKTYNGTTDVVGENIRDYIYMDDFIGFQDVSFDGTMEFASADAGDQDVTVHVTLTGKDAKYYALTTDTVTGKGIISPAPLTVTAQDVTIHYGDALTATAQYEGFVNGETSAVLEGELTYDTGYDAADPSKRGVGKYAITPAGLESDNYDITFVPGELTVEARPIRLKIDNKTVTYGDDAPKLTYTYDNLAYEDTAADVVNFDFDLDCDYRPGETGAGEVLPIKTSAVDAVPGNYLVTETTLGTLTVTQRPLTPVMDGITQKFYDGTTETNGENHHITVSVAENVLPEDDVTLDLAGTRYASADASDDYIPVIAVGITLGGADADNYYLTATTAQAEIGLINPAPLDIFADEKFITYGDDAPELTVTVKGLAPGETLADLDGELFITTDYDVTDPEKRDVDSYPIYLGGLKSSNYSICFIENFLWVEPAPLDLVIDAKTVIYGDATPGLTYSYKGLKFDDTAEDAGGPILETDYTPGSPAGSVYNIRVASKDVYNANYKVTSFTAANLTVEKRPLTPGLDGHTVKVYDGTTETNGEDHEITVTVMDEVFSGDDVILNFTNIRYASADASDQAVTVIAEGITLSGADADNYYLTATTAKADVGTIHRLDIADMDLPVEDFLYDGTEHTQTVSPEINGLVPTCTVAGQKATGIGCYTLTVTGNGNFCGVATATYYILPNDTDVQELYNTNPTSEDREALEKALAEVTGADRDLADEYLNNILDGQTQSYTELLDLLDKAAAAANTPAIQAVEDITAKNVRAEDKADLEKARVDLEAARNNYAPNYTDAEWVALWEDLERVKEALAVIANAEAVDSVLTQLPDTLDPEDGASMEAVEKVRKDYEQLSEVEKQLVPQEQKEKLDDLLTQLEAIHNAEVIRIYGDDRYATSLKTADELKAVLGVEKFENIVVARGSAFADALSGSYLATRKNAPILLVKAGDEEAVKAYIRQNLVSGGTVYILGGTEAVSAAMETGLEDFRVKRLGGADRYETNLMILEEAGVAGGDILITTGGAYADALSASAVDSPILLVGWKLTDAQLALLRTVSGKRIIVGGENAVSAKVEAGIRSTGETVRVAGADRYETSLLLAKMYFPDPEKAVLVYGENYPDGICGGPLANALKAPVLLVKDSKADAMAQFNASHSITVGYVLGGQKLLANGTVRVAFDMEGNAPIKVK